MIYWIPLISAAIEVSEGMHFDHFIVPAVQGGAGTSINMNINEIISNSALLKSGHECGDYDIHRSPGTCKYLPVNK